MVKNDTKWLYTLPHFLSSGLPFIFCAALVLGLNPISINYETLNIISQTNHLILSFLTCKMFICSGFGEQIIGGIRKQFSNISPTDY